MHDSPRSHQRPQLGFGLALRGELLESILQQRPSLDWLEILSDIYLQADAAQLEKLAITTRHIAAAPRGNPGNGLRPSSRHEIRAE